MTSVEDKTIPKVRLKWFVRMKKRYMTFLVYMCEKLAMIDLGRGRDRSKNY